MGWGRDGGGAGGRRPQPGFKEKRRQGRGGQRGAHHEPECEDLPSPALWHLGGFHALWIFGSRQAWVQVQLLALSSCFALENPQPL